VSATVFFADSNEFATLTNVFKVGGVPTDATVATVTVTDPTGAVTTPAVTHVSTGTYSATVACTIAGTWNYLWEGTGTAADAVAGTFTVSDPAVSRLYATPDELKSRLGITDTTDDFEIMIACQGAAGSIDEITGRYFWRGTDTRTYVPQSMYGQQLDDIVSVTTFKVDFDGDGVYEQTWTLNTDYVLTVDPGQYNAGSRGEQWPFTGFQVIAASKLVPFVWPWSHQDRIQVTGVFGWPAVPRNVKNAALIAAEDLFKLKDAPFGVAGFGEFGVIRVGSNPRVMSLLRRYISGDRVGV
jgi:hypothetical protein